MKNNEEKLKGETVFSSILLGLIVFLLTIYDNSMILSTAYFRMMEIILLSLIILEIRRKR
jgi:hypothetical protein